eukprot:2020142-Rhodomonas_salina.1
MRPTSLGRDREEEGEEGGRRGKGEEGRRRGREKREGEEGGRRGQGRGGDGCVVSAAAARRELGRGCWCCWCVRAKGWEHVWGGRSEECAARLNDSKRIPGTACTETACAAV